MRVIILRRASVEVSSASVSSATRVLRSTSGEGPSWRSWMEISGGMNFLRISTMATPMASTARPSSRPYSGVVSEYMPAPDSSRDLYCHGHATKTTISARPSRVDRMNQNATWRSARFSARVPGTGQRGAR